VGEVVPFLGRGQRGGRDCCGAEAGSRPVGGGLDLAGRVVSGVEGELVVGVFGGGEALGAQGDGPSAGTLQAEGGVKVVRGTGQRSRVAGGRWQGPGLGGAGPVGVPDSEAW
jgi:hypothetical protein